MAITPVKMLCSNTKRSIKFPYKMTPTRIVVHNTANDASAREEISYMCSNNKEVSFHFAIDDKEVVQGLPLDRNAWHAGDGGEGKGNREGISIEICYSKYGGSKFVAAEKLAAKFIAQLLKERNWGIDKVTKHQDYNGKYCPHRTLDMGWDRFLNMIKSEMEPAKKTTTTSSKVKKNDLVKLGSGARYYDGKAMPSWVKKTNWYVFEVIGDRAVLGKSADKKNEINSPVNTKYLTVVKAAATSTSKLSAGKKITLTKCPLYASSGALFSSGKVTGTYYLWESEATKNRIRITNNKANVGKSGQVTGWIKTSNVQ